MFSADRRSGYQLALAKYELPLIPEYNIELPYKAKEARRDAGLLSLVFHVFASDPERDRSGAQRTDGHDGDQYGHNQRFHGVLLS